MFLLSFCFNSLLRTHELTVDFFGWNIERNREGEEISVVTILGLEDGDLEKFLDKEDPPTHKETLFITLQIAKGLQFLHRLRIAHRDLKPQNILITTKKDRRVRYPFQLPHSNQTQSLTQYIFLKVSFESKTFYFS